MNARNSVQQLGSPLSSWSSRFALVKLPSAGGEAAAIKASVARVLLPVPGDGAAPPGIPCPVGGAGVAVELGDVPVGRGVRIPG